MNEPKKRSNVRPPLAMRWGPAEEDAAVSPRIEEAASELAATKERLAALEAAHAKCDVQLREMQERNTSLVQLTVASQLLCSGGDREDVFNAIEEIIINMIGSEELAIFELGPTEGHVRLSRLRGVERSAPRLASAVQPVREALSTGHPVFPPGRDIAAVVPLRMDSTSFGVIAVFRLLEQKHALDPLDYELLELLSRQGAAAIFSTAFRSLKPTVRPPTTHSP